VFYLAILSYSQSEDNPKKDLAKFDYKLNMIFKKKYTSIFLAILLEPCIEICRFFLNFIRIMAIENLKKHSILALFRVFKITFWLYIVSKKR